MRNGSLQQLLLVIVSLVTFIITFNVCAKNPDFSLSGGIAATAGTLGHQSDIGYSGAFGFEFKPDPTSSPELELVVRGGWQKFSTDTEYDYTIKSAELDIKLNYAFGRSPNLFVIGGGGLAEVEAGFKETSPIASLGIGIERGSLLLTARASRVFGDHFKEMTFFPIMIGITF